jgi:hypothetical protein
VFHYSVTSLHNLAQFSANFCFVFCRINTQVFKMGQALSDLIGELFFKKEYSGSKNEHVVDLNIEQSKHETDITIKNNKVKVCKQKNSMLCSLPKEVLLIIFHSLPSCVELCKLQRTCKYAYDLFKQNETSLWKQMYINMGYSGKDRF